VHFAVASAVAFLALLVLGLILGFPFLAIVAVSLVIGIAVAPSMRRAEIRALAAREEREPPA
jgi:type III secretory pathway component EscV